MQSVQPYFDLRYRITVLVDAARAKPGAWPVIEQCIADLFTAALAAGMKEEALKSLRAFVEEVAREMSNANAANLATNLAKRRALRA